MSRHQPKGFLTLSRNAALRAACGFAFLYAAQAVPEAHAYRSYDNGSGSGCVQCHPTFAGGPQHLLHASHVSNFGITECNLCHPNGGGSKPVLTYSSGAGGGLGCAGCHGQDYGEVSPNSLLPKASAYGLRKFHQSNGFATCEGTCHGPGNLGHLDPAPAILPESVLPPYFGQPTNDLGDSCSSVKEDSTFDADLVGLDNDGNGFADWPADLSCDMPTTTTTTTSTTSTTLPLECGPVPANDCIAPGKGALLVSEKSTGKEKLKVTLSKLQPAVAQGQFGDPVSGSTSYAICIYDSLGALRQQLMVARAAEICGTDRPDPCWTAVGSTGFKYGDKSAVADGIATILVGGGDAGKGKVKILGKNNTSAGQASLPTGIALMLKDNASATVQVVTSDAACFGVAVTQVKTADGVVFSAGTP